MERFVSGKELKMFKYLIAWLLGVPFAVLALIWLVSHLFH
jgi:hypothetical protein